MTDFDDAAAREWLDKMGWLALDDLVAKRQVTKILALVREHTRDAIAFREAWSEQDEGLVSHATAVQRAQQAAYTEGRAAVDAETKVVEQRKRIAEAAARELVNGKFKYPWPQCEEENIAILAAALREAEERGREAE